MILSGGYDHSVKLYDCRCNETVLSVNHGSPVESTLFLPSGGIFISAGGTEIKVWDIFNGGKLLANISQHHKTVSILRLASNNSRLMSASLDRHVKIYDISTFKVVHNIDFPNAVLSMAISENDEVLAVGMIDGVISIRKRDQLERSLNDQKVVSKFAPDHIIGTADEVVKKPSHSKEKCPEYENRLRKMEYTKALELVLKPMITSKHPENTISLLQELLRRQVLHVAMDGLNEKYIGSLLKFFLYCLGITRFTRTIIDSINVFIDVFESQVRHFSEINSSLYGQLLQQVKKEIDVCKKVCEIEGSLSLLLAGAQINMTSDMVDLDNKLAPSLKARKDLVIDV